MKHLNIRIRGRVQGVFFRSSAQEKARQLGIKGFIRNEPDGTVSAEAEGDDENLASFIEWLKKGPPGARVDDLSSTEGEVKNHDAFEVRH